MNSVVVVNHRRRASPWQPARGVIMALKINFDKRISLASRCVSSNIVYYIHTHILYSRVAQKEAAMYLYVLYIRSCIFDPIQGVFHSMTRFWTRSCDLSPAGAENTHFGWPKNDSRLYDISEIRRCEVYYLDRDVE